MTCATAAANQQSENHSKPGSGQSLTELALMLPLLLLILFGILDLGRAYDSYVTVTNAAREGARAGVNDPADSNGEIEAAAIREASNSGITVTSNMVAIDCAPAGSSSYTPGYCNPPGIVSGDQLRVSITYTFQFVTLSILGLGSVPVSTSGVMPVAVQ